LGIFQGREIRPEDIGLTTVKGDDETQPFMVAFLKATNHVQTKRFIRDVSTRRRVKKSDYASMMRDQLQPPTWRTCRIHTLYISFKDLQWQVTDPHVLPFPYFINFFVALRTGS
jgi:bone morphogenetic protein 7